MVLRGKMIFCLLYAHMKDCQHLVQHGYNAIISTLNKSKINTAVGIQTCFLLITEAQFSHM